MITRSSKSNRVLVLTIFLAGLLMSMIVSAEEKFKVRVGDFYPNYFRDSQGVWQGVDIELARALMERAKIDYEFVNIPWSRALVMAQAGQLNMLINTNFSQERSEFMYWVGPERYTQFNLIVREEHKNLAINSLDDLISACENLKKTIGYQPDVKYGEEFMRRLKSDKRFLNCIEPQVNPLNDDKLLRGRLLGYFDEPLDILLEKARNPDYELAVHPFVVIKEPVFFAVSKAATQEDTLLKLYVAYESLVADGTLQAIRQKWYE